MNSKQKVLLVSCGGLGNGGVQAIIMGIVRSLFDRFTFDIILFTSEVRHYDQEFLSYGGEIIRIPHYEGTNRYIRAFDSCTRDFFIYRKVKQLLKNRGPYIAIHCNKEFESAPIIKAAYDCGIKVRICHNHIINHKSRFIYQFINKIRQKFIIKYSTLKIGCSNEACHSIYGNSDYLIVNNFYDNKKFDPKLYDKFNKKSEFSLIQVGALCSNKNQLFSIKVLSELIKYGVNAKLTIIGFELEKTYKQQLIASINTLGLSDLVSLLPGNSNIPEILSKSSIFMMPSKSEGFGIALLEAQAMGLRCFASSSVPLTTNCGGVTYIELNKGANFWASTILNESRNISFRISSNLIDKFKLSTICMEYEKFYLGVK